MYVNPKLDVYGPMLKEMKREKKRTTTKKDTTKSKHYRETDTYEIETRVLCTHYIAKLIG